MMGILKKFRKKQKLCSDLHSRFGDPSITAPNDGSWNQLSTSGSSKTVERDSHLGSRHAPSSGNSDADEHARRRYLSKSKPSKASRLVAKLCSRDPGFRDSASDVRAAIPRENHQDWPVYQPEGKQKRDNDSFGNEEHDKKVHLEIPGNAPVEERGRSRSRSRPITPVDHFRDEIPPSSRGNNNTLNDMRNSERYTRVSPGEAAESPPEDRPSRRLKSPPLSVTSRMRHYSGHSSATDPASSFGGTMSSRHTSLTTSSGSTPPIPQQTPEVMKIAYNPAFRGKKHTRRPKRKEPEVMGMQELVPSYEELYG